MLNHKGVYCLLGDNSGKPCVYIGKTTEFLERIQKHKNKKSYWSTSIVFTMDSGELGEDDISYLEYKLWSLANEAKRYTMDNSKPIYDTNHFSKIRKEKLDEIFVQKAITITSVLGYDFFEKTPSNDEQRYKDFPTLSLKKGQIVATAKQIDVKEFWVLEGSQLKEIKISEKDKDSTKKSKEKWDRIRKEDYSDYIDMKKMELKKDILFYSPTAAADFILGYHVNGKNFWKTAEGKTLNDLDK